jgi:hypothetical protein
MQQKKPIQESDWKRCLKMLSAPVAGPGRRGEQVDCRPSFPRPRSTLAPYRPIASGLGTA